MISHVVEEIEHVYETVEHYKECAEDLRGAYVCLKGMVGHTGAAAPDVDHGNCKDVTSNVGEDQQIAEIEEKLGTDFISELEKSVSHSDFVDKLHAAQACPHGSSGPDELDAVMGPLGSWTIVDKSDAVDAMASYLAAWLSQTPEAQNLDPVQLQAALLSSLKEMKKSKFRQLLAWGSFDIPGVPVPGNHRVLTCMVSKRVQQDVAKGAGCLGARRVIRSLQDNMLCGQALPNAFAAAI